MSDKRTAILDATMDLVAEHGFHGTAMSKIATHSGVSAGIIYHYFDGKDDLMVALYKSVKEDFMRTLVTPGLEALSWRERLKTLWRNAFEFYASHPKETLYLEQFESSPYIGAVMAEYEDDSSNFLHRLMREGYETRRFKDLPFWAVYDLTFGVARAMARRQISGVIDLDDAMLDMIADACYEAVSVT